MSEAKLGAKVAVREGLGFMTSNEDLPYVLAITSG